MVCIMICFILVMNMTNINGTGQLLQCLREVKRHSLSFDLDLPALVATLNIASKAVDGQHS